MVSRRAAGFTLMEVLVALTLFGVFLYISALLTAQMRGYEARLPVDFLSHPESSAVVARVRRDVMDATNPYYLESYDKYSQSPTVLILYSLQESGFAETIVWDFSIKGEAHRHAFSVGAQTSEWTARGVPQFQVTDFPIEDHPDSVRLQATDPKGLLAIDEILQPRAHQ